jgi:hypothetical protein
MDYLIPRKDAVERMCGINCGCTRDMCMYGDNGCAMARFVEEIPSAPAVPLDKLCRMLAKYIGFPCNYSPIDEEMANYCGDQCEMDDIGCWKKVLSKWMEGLDDRSDQ